MPKDTIADKRFQAARKLIGETIDSLKSENEEDPRIGDLAFAISEMVHMRDEANEMVESLLRLHDERTRIDKSDNREKWYM